RPGITPALKLRADGDDVFIISRRSTDQQESPMTVLEIDNVTKTSLTDARMHEEAEAPDESRTTATREVRHEYTPTLPSLLNQLGVSLLVSTYQAGKVVSVGVAGPPPPPPPYWGGGGLRP